MFMILEYSKIKHDIKEINILDIKILKILDIKNLKILTIFIKNIIKFYL